MDKIFIDYNDLLLDVIPKLRTFKSVSGGEGKAYFLDDKLIVKEYTNVDDWDDFDKIFSLYCLEMKKFADKGFNVSRVYAWTRIPNMNHYLKGEKNKYKYYILEERVKGRELYFGYIADAYDLATDLCSRQEFKDVLAGNGKQNLFDEIMRRYFEDYAMMNECLESMSETELSKFLVDAYNMYLQGTVSYPDLFPHNIFVNDGNQIKIIDPHYETEIREKDLGKTKSDFVLDVVNLFIYNSFVNDPKKAFNEYKDYDFGRFEKVIEKNKKLSKQAIIRVLTLMNLYCDNPRLLTGRNGSMLFASLGMAFNRKDMSDIINVINFER